MDNTRLPDLPGELLCLVFDHLDLQDLLRMSHVCADCRAAAHAHPKFWRDISLAYVSEPQLQLFLFRLSYTTNIGLRLDVDLSRFHKSDQVQSVVQPAVGSNLYRTAFLRLALSPEYGEDIFGTLRQPAPHLERLCLDFFNDTAAVSLPSDILAGKCPLLRSLQLLDCALPETPVPAFSRVECVDTNAPMGRGLPADFFAHFPALTHLRVDWDGTFNDRERFYAQFEHAPPLQSLALLGSAGKTQTLFQRCPRLLSTPRIEVSRSREDLSLLASELPGPLGIELAAETPAGFARFTVLSHASGWRRTCVLNTDKNFVWPRAEFYQSASIGGRVTTLALGASLAYAAHLIGPLPVCETLHLTLDGTLKAKVKRPLHLPRLKKIVLSPATPSGARMDATDLECVLNEFLGESQSTSPVLLDMDGVSFSGELPRLSHHSLFGKLYECRL